MAAAFQSAIDEARRVRDESIKESQNIDGSLIEVLITTYKVMQNLLKQSRKLNTRLQTYQDWREDLDSWRQILDIASNLDRMAHRTQNVYGNHEFIAQTGKVWEEIRAKFEAQPLNILSLHREVGNSIQGELQKIVAWLESRREDFEHSVQEYRKFLVLVGIEFNVRIPFDQEQPTESYGELIDQVCIHLKRYCNQLIEELGRAYQNAHYGVQIQNLPLSETENRIESALERAGEIRDQVTPTGVRELRFFEDQIINQLVLMQITTKDLRKELQRALEKRLATGSEVHLIEFLQESEAGKSIDLRGLIIRLLDQEQERVDLDTIMKDLQSLFQKNQIAIYISLLHNE